MSIDWKRVLKGAAGMAVAAALCVAGTGTAVAAGQAAFPEDDTSTPTATGTPYQAASKDDFKTALEECTATSGPVTITVTGNLALTTNEITEANKYVECALTITTDGDHTVTWSDNHSMLWTQRNGSLTINGQTTAGILRFTAPSIDGNPDTTGVYGPLIHPTGSSVLTINGGDFTGLRAERGPVVYNAATTVINGGTFENNVSTKAKGGVVYQESGSTTITGGTFNNNYAYSANTRVDSSGGGVLHADAGTVEIAGGTFESNHTNASAYMSGGGAIYVHGKLTVANAADGTKPVFKNNWATEDGTNPITFNNDGSFTGSSMRGGAGGAIFLQGFKTDTDANRSYGYFLGGEFEGNVSGYLGGAIYTEEYTVSYVGPAAATLNTAGHFGGGLWFCPSGVSEASKSGNIALLDNRTNSNFDSNTDNRTSDDSPTEAGSDLAIMNPYFKSQYGVHDNAFLLLNTWFTDRGTPAVDWYWDGQPRTTASGYADRLQQNGAQGNRGRDAVRAYKYNGTDQYDDKTNPNLDDGKYKRYTTPEQSVKQESPTTIQQYWDKTGKDNTYGGIGLKAVLKEGTNWNNAWNSAKVAFKLNGARLSGGAFGSNGRVILATPYSAAWNKVDAENHATKIANTSWRVSANTGGNTVSSTNSDRLGYDAGCPAMNKRDPNDSSQNGCWMHRDGDDDGVVSIIVTDNGPRDNNPELGEFGIDNLSPGTGGTGRTYELREESVPAGYQKSDLVYTFTILPTQTAAPKIEVKGGNNNNAVVDDDNDGVARGITNMRLPGLSWTKVGLEDTAKPLEGSVWKISGTTPDPDGKPINVGEIKDCIADKTVTDPCKDYKDKDPDAGKFRVENLQKGTYTLTETTAPEGHWLSTDTYTFTVNGTSGEKVQIKNNNTDVASNTIVDETMGVAWTKSDSNDKTGDHPLANSAWKIYPKNENADSASAITVTDCASDPCLSGSKDLDTAQGMFKVTGLTPGQYTLEETQAPDGYQLPEKSTWTFEIKSSTATSDPQHTITDVKITGDNLGTNGNVILNSKTPVSQLPFTGGRSGLDWLLIGGGLALAAATAGLVTGRASRREEL